MPSAWRPSRPASMTTNECRWPGSANWASSLGSYFDLHPHAGRDRDRFIQRSMGFVVLDEIVRFRLGRAGKPEQHLDSLKDGGVAAMTDGFDVDLDLFQTDAGVPRPTLHQQHAAGRDARQERFGRCDLLTGTAKVRRLIDDELMIAHLIEGTPRSGGAGGVNAGGDEVVSGHASSSPPRWPGIGRDRERSAHACRGQRARPRRPPGPRTLSGVPPPRRRGTQHEPAYRAGWP